MKDFLKQCRPILDGTPYLEPQDSIFKTNNIKGATPTNKWWSSAVWKNFSSAMYPHPFAVKAYEGGLGVAYPSITVDKNKRTDHKKFINGLYTEEKRDFTIGCSSEKFDTALVDGYGDWTVDLLFKNKTHASEMRTTLGLGSPYIYITSTKKQLELKTNENIKIWFGEKSEKVIGIEINQHYYGIFLPEDGSWELLDACSLRFHLSAKKNYMSIALLPDKSDETIHLFHQHAYAFVVDSTVSWEYDDTNGKVTTTYSVKTDVKEGTHNDTLMCLYPHQWRNSTVELTSLFYHSPRGQMKVIKEKSFQTELTYRGILPFLPSVNIDEKRIQEYLDEVMDNRPLLNYEINEGGTYWLGKNLGKLSQLIPIAFQLGKHEEVQELCLAISSELKEWFTMDDGKKEKFLYYNENWGTLIGYPSGFGADTVLNDHHFHYGYWVYAMAMVLLFSEENISKEMINNINVLIDDFANDDRGNEYFPFMRNFEPYAGHSWASGNAMDLFDNDQIVAEPGNNQESSSESINAWAALILWGEATGNQRLKNKGIYLYTTEVESVFNYWFDVHGDTMPEEYHYKYAPIVFSSGVEYCTWWTLGVEEIHMINMLPITAASLYLGYYPEYAKFNYETMIKEIGGIEEKARDIIWSYQALFDSKEAMRKFDTLDYVPDFGESKAHTYQWIKNLCSLGQVDPTITANTPLFSAFKKDETSTFLAYNASVKEKEIVFVNEHKKIVCEMLVPARTMRVEKIKLENS